MAQQWILLAIGHQITSHLRKPDLCREKLPYPLPLQTVRKVTKWSQDTLIKRPGVSGQELREPSSYWPSLHRRCWIQHALLLDIRKTLYIHYTSVEVTCPGWHGDTEVTYQHNCIELDLIKRPQNTRCTPSHAHTAASIKCSNQMQLKIRTLVSYCNSGQNSPVSETVMEQSRQALGSLLIFTQTSSCSQSPWHW